MQSASAKLPETIERLSRTLHELERLVDRNQGPLSRALHNVESASRDLEKLMGRANRYPAGVLFGEPPRPVDPGKE